VLVERLVWDQDPGDIGPDQWQLAGPGFSWFRFWLPDHQQIVERYFDAQGRPLGTCVDLCTAPEREEEAWLATDLLLDIWISPEGRVTVRNEPAFEQALRQGLLLPAEAAQADQHCRELTAAIAKGRFPPALVRNWQVDIKQIQRSLEGRHDSDH
jgi:predicted RNA-binding protein associated with RNAse of E/G family